MKIILSKMQYEESDEPYYPEETTGYSHRQGDRTDCTDLEPYLYIRLPLSEI